MPLPAPSRLAAQQRLLPISPELLTPQRRDLRSGEAATAAGRSDAAR